MADFFKQKRQKLMTRKIIKLSNLVLLLLFLLTLSCQTFASKNYRLNHSINSSELNANIGVKIVSLTNNKTIFAHNSKRLFMPASALKLFTTAAALHYLGPSFRFKSEIYTSSVSEDGKDLKNIYLKGYGDPSFSENDLSQIVARLSQMGVQKITGNIVVDSSYFDNMPWGKGWMWDDLIHGYSAPISAVNLNNNRIVLRATPGFFIKSGAKIAFWPNSQYFTIKNSSQTVAMGENSLKFVLNEPKKVADWPVADFLGLKKSTSIEVLGNILPSSAAKYKSYAVFDSSYFVGFLLKEKLQQANIKFDGDIKKAATPKKPATLLIKHESKPLYEIINNINKYSNNHATDCLVKAIGAYLNPNEPGSFAGGAAGIIKFLGEQVIIPKEEINIFDGSGASRYSLVSANSLVKLLQYVHNNFEIGPEFIASLPIAGVDGSLSERMTEEPLYKRIRAKTGTMTSVSTLAGFLTTKNDTYAFAILINNSTNNQKQLYVLQEKILTSIL
ncbi:D-alanyl-D-alanine carboxypeptidase/D-alanyl-D-alanine-endopeptidase [Sulfobacillus acidophilus]|uniref:D-alanyl-D-alanine carboxypeptidase/D-alanyl-D-alanine-endopeptidase n=1 Tax=Sulfobacillus acidophilus TaxID=53633 RepID=A0ABS3AVL9_9FIRM|nr:D-alanyl-D-alanine carboxypeptidase/D-alanyl-D-alanine-endopeptidase [Sulfobacillus acidophilus]